MHFFSARGIGLLAGVFVFLTMLQPQFALAQTVTPWLESGDPSKRVDIVVVGDGYTAAELGDFASDVNQFFSGIFAQEPFREYKNYFNVRRIDIASNESGADHPERTPAVVRDTAFDAAYNCGNIQRLICVSTSKVLTAISVLPPSQRDLVMVIVNDPEYGGSGGVVAVALTHVAAVELILHETGHTFALLADEYTSQPPTCNDSVEPFESNSTRETDRSALKWSAWVDNSTPLPTTTPTLGVPGAYLGSKYCPTTLYRPTYDSKMRSLGRPYEQINSEQFIRRFYQFARPIDSKSPTAASVNLTHGQSQQFTVTTTRPATHSLAITWRLNGQQVGTGSEHAMATAGLTPGVYTLTVTVLDTTPMVRIDPQNLLREDFAWTVFISGGATFLSYSLPTSGGYSNTTQGSGGLYVGHAIMDPSAGAAQAGLAIFALRQNNITVSEAAVPASARMRSGRIYAEIGGAVNTGIAISNPNASPVNIAFFTTDTNGVDRPGGSLTLGPSEQIARFLNQPPFNTGGGAIAATFRGTLTFTASDPVGAIALRGFTNERSEFLITTLPVLDLSASASTAPVLFPHFAAGDGWTTQLVLVNPSDEALSGTLTFRNPSSGAPLTLAVDGSTASSFTYSVAGKSSRRLATTVTAGLQNGSVQLVPAAGQSAPVGLVVFSFRAGGITISEAGVPTVAANSRFLLYAEASGTFGQPGSVQPGLALANASANPVVVSIVATNLQGQQVGQGSVNLAGNGQSAVFLNQISGFEGIPLPFQGRLRVSAGSPAITAVGLRARYNERGDFLITTTPPFVENQAAGSVVFPHFVDGGGYTTQFVVISGQSQPSGGTLLFFNSAGQAIAPTFR